MEGAAPSPSPATRRKKKKAPRGTNGSSEEHFQTRAELLAQARAKVGSPAAGGKYTSREELLEQARGKHEPPSRKALAQQQRLEDQWSVGLAGGAYNLHTRHVPPSASIISPTQMLMAGLHHPSDPLYGGAHEHLSATYGASPTVPYVPRPPSPTEWRAAPERAREPRETRFNRSEAWDRSSAGNKSAQRRAAAMPRGRPTVAARRALAASGELNGGYSGGSSSSGSPLRRGEAEDAVLTAGQGTNASGPIPVDGVTTDAYRAYVRKKLAAEMGCDVEHLDQRMSAARHL